MVTSNYQVELRISGDVIESYSCNCPYDHGPICKHIVAAFITYMENELATDTKPLDEAEEILPEKEQSDLEVVLEAISAEELKAYFKNVLESDEALKNKFMTRFGEEGEKRNKTYYAQQIRAVLKHAAGRDKFIFYHKMRWVIQEVEVFFEMAEQAFAVGNYQTVFYISAALLEEMNKAINFADDSDGGIGTSIYRSVELMGMITQLKEAKAVETQKDMYSYGVKRVEKGTFRGWDWHFDMIRLAGKCASTQKQAKKVLTLCQNLPSYWQDDIDLIVLELAAKYDIGINVEAYKTSRLHNPKIRELLIDEALKEEKIERAITLCEEGIKNEEREEMRDFKWTKKLLEIAQQNNDIKRIQELSKKLFFQVYDGTAHYYQLLKSAIAPENWNAFLDDLLKEVEQFPHGKHDELFKVIYLEENRLKELLNVIRQQQKGYPNLYEMEELEAHFQTDYQTPFLELYADVIRWFLEQNATRKHYKAACRYIRRIKKMKGPDIAEDLIEELKSLYVRRPALIEELDKV